MEKSEGQPLGKKERIREFIPSDKRLVDLWGINESTVKRQRKNLEKLGYFKIVEGE